MTDKDADRTAAAVTEQLTEIMGRSEVVADRHRAPPVTGGARP